MKWKERGMVSMINKDYFKYLIKQNKKKKFLDFPVDRSEMVWYTIKAKQRRLIASASPPA